MSQHMNKLQRGDTFYTSTKQTNIGHYEWLGKYILGAFLILMEMPLKAALSSTAFPESEFSCIGFCEEHLIIGRCRLKPHFFVFFDFISLLCLPTRPTIQLCRSYPANPLPLKRCYMDVMLSGSMEYLSRKRRGLLIASANLIVTITIT